MAHLRLFASIREAAGNRSQLELDASTIDELIELAAKELEEFGDQFKEQIQICRIWLNGEPADLKTPISDTDEVALLPPVSGGSLSEDFSLMGEPQKQLHIGMVSFHTSPFIQPGEGDSGGLNVYVRQLAFALAHRGHHCTIYVRKTDPAQPSLQYIEPGVEISYLEAGDYDLPLRDLPEVVNDFAFAVAEEFYKNERELKPNPDVLHANYWLSGIAAHYLKHEFNIPLITTFHTLGRVKQNVGEWVADGRIDEEEHVMQCSEAVSAVSAAEVEDLINFYSIDPERIHRAPAGANHAFFSPGNKMEARKALGISENVPLILFVGRIQPLKRFSFAVQSLAELNIMLDTTPSNQAQLLVVGGPSGPDGEIALSEGLELAESLGVREQISLVNPQPHHLLATYYRSADLVIMPSLTESFGLVALEAMACGTPVVATEVGGLTNLIEHEKTGILVREDTPTMFAESARRILTESTLSATISLNAAVRAGGYTWSATAEKLEALYTKCLKTSLVEC